MSQTIQTTILSRLAPSKSTSSSASHFAGLAKAYPSHSATPLKSANPVTSTGIAGGDLSATSRRRRLISVLLMLVVVTALLAGCGSRNSGADEDLEARTAEIARGYAANSDINSARTALEGLGVANSLQWLIYSTESAIASNNDPELTRAYVTLALEMGVRESTIRDWAAANGLVEPSAATAVTGGATLAAAVLQPIPTVAALAPPAEASAPITTTAPVSDLASAPAAAPAATATTAPVAAQLTVAELVNLREGPGTEYNLAGSLSPNESASIVAKDSSGQWWQIRTANGGLAWLYSPLASTTGDTSLVALAADIPTPPPATPTTAPAIVAAPAAPAAEAPAAPADPAAAPAPEPTAAPAAGNPSDQPHFTLVQRRMWTKEENGACAGQHLLRITVLDANGSPLNGITLQGIYTGEMFTTGDQGKGDGRIEYDLYGTGEGFRVVRNNDGREATSDNAEGFTTKSLDIDVPTLIGGGYCADEADCQIFYNSYGCTGHHSWEATFKRNF